MGICALPMVAARPCATEGAPMVEALHGDQLTSLEGLVQLFLPSIGPSDDAGDA